jgi:hypothetical protein
LSKNSSFANLGFALDCGGLQKCCFVRGLFIIWFIFLCLLVANCPLVFQSFKLGDNGLAKLRFNAV